MFNILNKHINKFYKNKECAIIIGSSPLALKICNYKLKNFYKIAVNNSWRVRKDFDYLVYPDDFPEGNLPNSKYKFSGREVDHSDYMLSINKAGGILYAGATMAFAAGYWAVDNVRAPLIGFYASDMIYNTKDKNTHFYGKGTPDPLREDVSLRSLEARSIRLFAWALRQNKLLVNFSDADQSRLMLPRVKINEYKYLIPNKKINLSIIWKEFLEQSIEIDQIERNVEFYPLAVDYWNIIKTDEEISLMKRLDELWNKNIANLRSGWKKYFELMNARIN